MKRIAIGLIALLSVMVLCFGALSEEEIITMDVERSMGYLQNADKIGYQVIDFPDANLSYLMLGGLLQQDRENAYRFVWVGNEENASVIISEKQSTEHIGTLEDLWGYYSFDPDIEGYLVEVNGLPGILSRMSMYDEVTEGMRWYSTVFLQVSEEELATVSLETPDEVSYLEMLLGMVVPLGSYEEVETTAMTDVPSLEEAPEDADQAEEDATVSEEAEAEEEVPDENAGTVPDEEDETADQVEAGKTAKTVKGGVKMREEPNKAGALVIQLQKNRTVTILETVTNEEGETWYKVVYQKNKTQSFEGYVRSDMLLLE